MVAASLGTFVAGSGVRDGVRAGMSLAQIGEFSFIIAGVGLATGAIRPFLYPVAVAVSALTTLATPFLVRASDPAAQWVDRKLPRPLQTYAALYGSWIERLREGTGDVDEATAFKRLVRLVLVELALLVALVVATGAEMSRGADLLMSWLGWTRRVAQGAILATAGALAVPLLVALVRATRLLAMALGVRALPAPARGLDRAEAPRRALVASLHFALLLASSAPVLLVLQPFVPQVPTIAVFALLVLALGIVLVQSAGSLYGHARAGAEVFAMALSQHDRVREGPAEIAATVRRVSQMLPGLGDPEPLVLDGASPAVGRSLGELDLRGRTGATVLSLMRADGSSVPGVPSGAERLSAGDVLLLAGTEDAVAAARQSLAPNAAPTSPIGL
jgi:CPA2 family monovalent cation:H+ antiporter-2